MSNDENNISRLSSAESEDLAAHLSDAGRSGLPLSSGLRAAAEEATSGRLARTLRSIAGAVEKGQPLDEVLQNAEQQMTGHVAGLVAAAVRTDRFGEALSDLVEHQREIRQLRRTVASALTYPLIMLGVTFVLIALATVLIIPPFREMFLDFELELPAATQTLFWWNEFGLPGIVSVLGLIVFTLSLVRMIGGRVVWDRLMFMLPVFGPMTHWSGVAQWSRLMSLLMEQDVPLPEALKMAAHGSSNGNVGEVSLSLAALSEQGIPLSQLVDSSPRLPKLLVPLCAWGEETDNLGEALRTASDYYTERVRLRSTLFRAILPPLVFIVIGLVIGWMVLSLFMPLVSLVQGLSG